MKRGAREIRSERPRADYGGRTAFRPHAIIGWIFGAIVFGLGGLPEGGSNAHAEPPEPVAERDAGLPQEPAARSDSTPAASDEGPELGPATKPVTALAKPEVNSPPAPFYATVSAKKLRLRTGPSMNYHAYSSLGRDDGVVVVEVRGVWRRIVMPPWETLFVHKNYVRLEEGVQLEDGVELNNERGSRDVRGVVHASRLVVRILPERKHEAAGLLPNGSMVSVRGRNGNWLAIAPTPDTHAWVHGEYLKFQRPLGPTDVISAWRASLGNWRQHGQVRGLRGGSATASTEKTEVASSQPSVRDGAGGSDVSAVAVPSSSGTSSRSRVNENSDARSSKAARQSEVDRLSVGRSRNGQRNGEREDHLDRLIRRARRLVDADKTGTPTVPRNSEKQSKNDRHRNLRIRNDKAHEHSIAQDKDPRFDRKREGVGHDGTSHARGRVAASLEKQSGPHGANGTHVARGRLKFLRRDRNGQDVYCLSHGKRVLYYLKSRRGSGIKLDSFRDQQVDIRGSVRKLDPKYGVDLILVSNIEVMTTQ